MSKVSDFYIFGVVDATGAKQECVCNDTCEDIYIEAINAKGDRVSFESDAYHLEEWAKGHNFDYFKHGYDFSDLRSPTVYAEAVADIPKLTLDDKILIMKAITGDGHAKALMESVCIDDPTRCQIEDFLAECRHALMEAIL